MVNPAKRQRDQVSEALLFLAAGNLAFCLGKHAEKKAGRQGKAKARLRRV